MDFAQIIEWLKEYKDAVASIGLIVSGIWAVWVWKKKQTGGSTTGIQNQNSPNSGKQINAPVSANDRATVSQHIGDKHYHHGLSIEDAMKIAEKLAAEKGEQDAQLIQSLQETIQALTQQNAQKYDIQQAFDRLAQGDITQTEAIFTAVAEEAKQAGQAANGQEAQALRHLGSLVFLHDTQKALTAYQRSTELDPANLDGWNNLGHLYRRMGELENAANAYTTVLERAKSNKKAQAAAYGNLGLVYRIRGDLERALGYHEKALALNREIRSMEGMASNYGNLGSVYRIRGDLDLAIEYHEKSLAIEKELGRKIGMANQYGSLGIVYQTRGDLDRAIGYYDQALALNREIGNMEGMASDYGNLGIVYHIRGDLDRAIEYHDQSLAIEKELGRKEGMANQYGNLGSVYQTRGDLDRAVGYYEESLALFQQLDAEDRVTRVQSLINAIVQKDSH